MAGISLGQSAADAHTLSIGRTTTEGRKSGHCRSKAGAPSVPGPQVETHAAGVRRLR